ALRFGRANYSAIIIIHSHAQSKQNFFCRAKKNDFNRLLVISTDFDRQFLQNHLHKIIDKTSQ
ncbi:MAG: hypothetical protein IJ484_01635, partial [Oscillospiraceae bacterium]|nr:hypothetical protein [Oscillospiraceae bacterium]